MLMAVITIIVIFMVIILNDILLSINMMNVLSSKVP
jgi:hypothetical protein